MCSKLLIHSQATYITDYNGDTLIKEGRKEVRREGKKRDMSEIEIFKIKYTNKQVNIIKGFNFEEFQCLVIFIPEFG